MVKYVNPNKIRQKDVFTVISIYLRPYQTAFTVSAIIFIIFAGLAYYVYLENKKERAKGKFSAFSFGAPHADNSIVLSIQFS